MVNVSVLVGRLTKDVQVNKTSKGTSVANFTLAVQDRVDREKAHFIRCVAWGAQADFMGNYLGKGSLVSVEGEIHTGSYEDRDGKTVFTTEVNVRNLQALESKAEREARQHNAGMQQQRPRNQAPDEYASPQTQQQYSRPTQQPSHHRPPQQSTQRPQPDPTLDINSDDLPF